MRQPSLRSTVLTIGVATGIVGSIGCGATRHRLDSPLPWEWATRAYEHPAARIPVDLPKSILPPPPESVPEALKEKVTLRSEAIDIRSLMLGLAKQTGLNITLDPDVTGQVSAYFNDVTVIDALRNIADQLSAEVEIKNNVVSVHHPRNEYRMYRLHYLRNPRAGSTNIGVLDRQQTPGPNTVIPPAAPAVSQLGGIIVPTMPTGGGSAVQLVSAFGSNFWEDLDSELVSIIFEGVKPEELSVHDRRYAGISASDSGGRSLIVDSMAGTILVHARRNVLEAISDYLDAINKTVQRQVVIDVQILEVSFSDTTIFGIESSNAPFLPSSILTSLLQSSFFTNGAGGSGTGGGAWVTSGTNTGQAISPAAFGATVTTPLGYPNINGVISTTTGTGAQLPLQPSTGTYGISLFTDSSFTAGNRLPFQVLVQALGQLGDVKFVSAPRLTALHNQKAVFKVVQDRVFWTVQGGTITPASATTPTIVSPSTYTPTVVPEGVSLDVTPLIGDDGSVTMEIHPTFAVILDSVPQPGNTGGSQPEVERREFDTTVRVEGEQTVFLGGMVSEHSQRTETGLPYLKDIPFLGALFRDTSDEVDKTEIIIIMTPKVQDARLMRDELNEFRAAQGQDPVSGPGGSKSR